MFGCNAGAWAPCAVTRGPAGPRPAAALVSMACRTGEPRGAREWACRLPCGGMHDPACGEAGGPGGAQKSPGKKSGTGAHGNLVPAREKGRTGDSGCRVTTWVSKIPREKSGRGGPGGGQKVLGKLGKGCPLEPKFSREKPDSRGPVKAKKFSGKKEFHLSQASPQGPRQSLQRGPSGGPQMTPDGGPRGGPSVTLQWPPAGAE